MTSTQTTAKESSAELVPVKFSRLTRRGVLLGLSLAQLITLAISISGPALSIRDPALTRGVSNQSD